MRQVAAFSQTHAHDGVARFEESQKHGLVGRCTAVWLHIRAICTEELLHTVDGQRFGHIDVDATAVVTLTGIALGIFIRQLCALCSHHGRGGIVFAGNQLDMVFLASILSLNSRKQLGVGLLDEDRSVVHVGSPEKESDLAEH